MVDGVADGCGERAVVGPVKSRIAILATIAAICVGAVFAQRAIAEEWPVSFSWSYTQPVPEHVAFELYVRTCSTCDFEAAETTRRLAVSRSYDYDALQPGSYVAVLDIRTGEEIERIPALQTRLDARLLPALRACRMGGDCPGAGAMQRLLREDGKRAVPRDRVAPRVIEP